ncbi:MAG TPA: hypothetical protein VHB20_07815 [Verrucomicrobiae bacterium]|nr:hypothetical protein [Verrucomicrobiae bacterium]
MLGLWLTLTASAWGGVTFPVRHSYINGFSSVFRLGESLCEILPPKFGEQLNPRAVTVLRDERPIITPVTETNDGCILGEVAVSDGMIDFLNHVAHAKAVDMFYDGYFKEYLKSMTNVLGDHPTFPEIDEERYWAEPVSSLQMSYFNQMIGFLMAMNLSHHYLGHYMKYAERITSLDKIPEPINRSLTSEEWETSVRAGAVNACGCALLSTGARALFEALNRLPERPEWAAYLAPPKISLRRLNRELASYEFDFFHASQRDSRDRWLHAGTMTPRDFGY